MGVDSPESGVYLVQERGKCGLWSVEVSWIGREPPAFIEFVLLCLGVIRLSFSIDPLKIDLLLSLPVIPFTASD